MAWLVHLLTASGAVLAWLSLRAVIAGDRREAFAWLAAAVVVDAVDGLAARAARVKERIPQIDGAHLDDLVDFLTFVFVPAWMATWPGLVPAGWGTPVGCAIVVASAFGFSRVDAKTADHYFTGFPSYWNIVLLYLVVFQFHPAVNAAILIALVVLVFVPIRYVYPSRTPQHRALTNALGATWGACCLWMIYTLPHPPGWIVALSLVFPCYYVVLSLVLTRRRARGA